MKKETLFVSFSGGRTSGYMCWWLLNNKADEYDFIFTFANTGAEHEKTLEFVNECDVRWGLNLVWLEAKVNPEVGAPIEFSVVDFKTASRKGEPFKALAAKHGVPNRERPFCTQYLKTNVINAYKRSLGFKSTHATAIGIRADEADRANINQAVKGHSVYPFITMKHTTKDDVISFFESNDFDLEVDERLGNCVTCFKKSERHLMTIAKMDQGYFGLFSGMERNYGHIKDASGGICKPNDPYVFFRGNKSTGDILSASKGSFREFDPSIKQTQMGMDLGAVDLVGDCGSSCEVY